MRAVCIGGHDFRPAGNAGLAQECAPYRAGSSYSSLGERGQSTMFTAWRDSPESCKQYSGLHFRPVWRCRVPTTDHLAAVASLPSLPVCGDSPPPALVAQDPPVRRLWACTGLPAARSGFAGRDRPAWPLPPPSDPAARLPRRRCRRRRDAVRVLAGMRGNYEVQAECLQRAIA
jgi:hypothetical protein